MIAFLATVALAARPDVTVIVSGDIGPYLDPVPAFTDAVGVPVQTINIHGRWVEAEVEILALKAAEPEVVFALGAKAAWTVRNLMPNTPMIYAAVLDPERYGLPGNQVTGIHATVAPVTYLSQVSAYFPTVTDIGVIRGTGITAEDEEALNAAAKEVGLRLTIEKVDSPRTFRRAFNSLAESQDAVWVSPERGVLTPEAFRTAVEEMRRRRKPLLADTENMVTAGAAFAVTPSPEGIGRQAAELAKRVLDGGAPAIMPVEDPLELSTAINIRTLEAGEIAFEALMVDFANVVIE
ncbi:MAG: hypothetical protein KC656_13300 [Myxococcales bacterium]|nr:hypothetical protein [Myxococcales bacterium]MCB9672294.1 hypothetical protein [Alphaproteobacteria bacterium]MCB9692706.1 hypothetical protein [Alphaproteobacteria bacterium]